MKNMVAYSGLFIFMSIMSIVPVQAMYTSAHFVEKSYLQQVSSWTEQKIDQLKNSVRKHPWHYAAGAATVATSIALGVYAYKLRHVSPASALSVVPPTQPTRNIPTTPFSSPLLSNQVIRNINTGTLLPLSPLPVPNGAVMMSILPSVAPAVVSQENPRQFLIGLKEVLEGDLFLVGAAIESKQYDKISLKCVDKLTQATCLEALHGGLCTLKDNLLFAANHHFTPPANMDELKNLERIIKTIRARTEDALGVFK